MRYNAIKNFEGIGVGVVAVANDKPWRRTAAAAGIFPHLTGKRKHPVACVIVIYNADFAARKLIFDVLRVVGVVVHSDA